MFYGSLRRLRVILRGHRPSWVPPRLRGPRLSVTTLRFCATSCSWLFFFGLNPLQAFVDENNLRDKIRSKYIKMVLTILTVLYWIVSLFSYVIAAYTVILYYLIPLIVMVLKWFTRESDSSLDFQCQGIPGWYGRDGFHSHNDYSPVTPRRMLYSSKVCRDLDLV